MTELFYEIKGKIENLAKIPFTEETWKWYLEEGLNKRLQELEPIERHIIKQFAHSRRAVGIMRTSK